ncbi:MAG TPA: TetR family transcriptional regulator [Solirubrobacteraceae bacterium]|nr:TetR family transcriptional regulator [Solirubrobacteraceae bacterium]
MSSQVDHSSGAVTRARSNGLSRAQVLSIQRKRILSAAADVVGERRYSHATVSDVVARARVSRKTFYEVFTSWEDCFMCVFDAALSRAQLLAQEAYTHERTWREGIRAALIRLLLFVEEEPVQARILITEPFAVGGFVLQRRAEALRDLAGVLERGRTASTAGPPMLTAEALIGGVASILHGRIMEGSTRGLIDLSGELMSMIVLPYKGAAVAKRELSRPLPTISRKAGPATGGGPEDPLAGLKLRLTYRTVQVLGSIGEHSGASNREIADVVGMSDQGQISKLLARLEHLGLLENRGAGQANGAANAWHLTAQGAHLERSTSVYGVS